MDELWGYDAKWNKSDGERQMPYNFTHKWNVTNKSNQAKTSTYTENKILGTRGMGWAQGQMGEEGQLNGDKWKL